MTAAISPLLDPARLHPLLGPLAVRLDVDSVTDCTSTNDLLAARAAAGAASGTVIIADRQQAGRGRRGRQWLSSPADSLTFSLLWRFPRTTAGESPVPLSGLSLAVGLGVVRGLLLLAPALTEHVGLKWPNDLLLQAAGSIAPGKLGGILVELASDRRGTQAIIGIGLNLRAPVLTGLPTHNTALPPAGLDQVLPVLPVREQVLACLLRGLVNTLDAFALSGFAPLRQDWESWHLWQGQAVALLDDGQAAISGICRGVDEAGALRLETPDGLRTLLAGDLSLRPLAVVGADGLGGDTV